MVWGRCVQRFPCFVILVLIVIQTTIPFSIVIQTTEGRKDLGNIAQPKVDVLEIFRLWLNNSSSLHFVPF